MHVAQVFCPTCAGRVQHSPNGAQHSRLSPDYPLQRQLMSMQSSWPALQPSVRQAFSLCVLAPCGVLDRSALRALANVQANGLVPIVEPEIMIDGEHSIDRSAQAAMRVLHAVVSKLWQKEVLLEACILKLQMVMPGSEAKPCASKQIAEYTLQVLNRCSPFLLVMQC